jgi:hypothetical protein
MSLLVAALLLKDPYKVLGVDAKSPQDEIKKAYYKVSGVGNLLTCTVLGDISMPRV